MSRISIEARLVTVAQDMRLRAGDRILVIGDTCIGSYGSRTPPTPPPAPDRPVWTDDEIVAATSSTVPQPTRRIGDYLGLEADDLVSRNRLSVDIQRLVREGRLTKTNDSRIGLYVASDAQRTMSL